MNGSCLGNGVPGKIMRDSTPASVLAYYPVLRSTLSRVKPERVEIERNFKQEKFWSRYVWPNMPFFERQQRKHHVCEDGES
jgi:hypothetical protein